ncbi:MAG: TadE/TadG family type IV pilus assembly protein [Caulobacterales bacterium]
MSARRLSALWARWRADTRGVAAVEFAMVLPILMVIYLVGFETSQAVAAYRKLTDTTVQLGNVTTQYTTMSALDVNNVLNASAQIMSPDSTTNLTIVLSEVTTDVNGNATVTWSKTFQGTALAVGSAVTPPTGSRTPNTNYILVQTTYTYVPTVGANVIGNFPMNDQIWMLPRQSPAIPYTG